MTLVTNGPSGLVAAGQGWGDDGPLGMVWRSSDGLIWDVIGSGGLFDLGPCPAGCASLESIAAGPSGIVLAGYRVVPDGSRFRLETDFWFSSGSAPWERIPVPVRSGSTDRPAAELAVAARASGFVAAGSVCDAQGMSCRAVTWTSTSGRDWGLPVELPDGAGARALQVAAGHGRAVILGMRCGDSGCRIVVWGSDDGATWTSGSLVGSYVEGSTQLALAGDTFMVMSSVSDLVGSTNPTKVWTSGDGLAWTSQPVELRLVPTFPIDQILDLAGRPDGALAIGQRASSTKAEEQLGVWLSP